ncbi:MAG: nucleoside triphosphate pyrophosphohydrolase family protein [Candidatus Competibacteraceae bacterium]|nr:nucleoside triphosphate pyrophosphohydrolase family protein [Candidatus Competibacteraceae bacterium]
MTFDEYQEQAHATSFNTEIGDDTLLYPVLGLLGEAGEIANKAKKIYRDNSGYWNNQDIDKILDEVADCCWYIAEICTQVGVSFDDIMKANLRKLADRAERGVIGGNGDNR